MNIRKILVLLLTIAPSLSHGEVIDLAGRRLPGLKLTYTNTVMLEAIARRELKSNVDTEKVRVEMVCYKKWKVRGRDSARAYQCDPIKLEAPYKD